MKRPSAEMSSKRQKMAEGDLDDYSGPKKRMPRPHEHCEGRGPFEPCIFSTTELRGKARVKPDLCRDRCLFCDDDRLKFVAGTAKGHITKHLRKLHENNPEAVEPALVIMRRVLGDDVTSEFVKVIETRAVPERRTKGYDCQS